MARRKSLLAQLYQEARKASAARERQRVKEAKEFARNQERIRREMEAEQRAVVREEERQHRDAERTAALAAAARERQLKTAQVAAARAELERARAVAAAERDRAARARDAAKSAVEAKHAEARARTDAITACVAAMESVLLDRCTALRGRSHEVGQTFGQGDPESFATAVDVALATSRYPGGLAVGVSSRFHPESRELVVDCELPRQDVVPKVVGHRYRPRDEEFRPEPRKDAETKRIYQLLIARVALRVVAEVFSATPAPLVDSVIFNGFVSARDRATGQPIRPCVISLVATRELVDGLVLDEPELDPVRCLGHLRAIMSDHPYDLEPIKPVSYFDPSKYKLIDEFGAIAGLDHRLDLLTLSPVEFEYLIQRLFEKVGMKSWVRNTRESKDEGVDAVAVNEDPLVGGICVIQAKRWKDVVGLESVHALAGVMGDKAATRGILVTTSWFGKASLDFVHRHGRMQLIDGRNLKNMLAEYLDLDVLISLPKLPRGWHPDDLA